MTGKVFLSCGQRPPTEKQIANKIKKLLKEKFNLDCYVAINVQSLNDIMKITDQLKSSDYFLFIDFFRKGEDYSCSLFSHQELALAHHLGFKDNIIAFKEKDAPQEGFIKYVQSNPEPFENEMDLLTKIEKIVKERNWNKNFSRNLVVDHIEKFPIPIIYKDHTGSYFEILWQAHIFNHRPDVAAVNSVCVLDYIEYPDGKSKDSIDRNYLKWSTKKSYRRIILPKDHALIDILAIHLDEKNPGIFLHSDWDMIRPPIVNKKGKYKFHYKVFAEGFPMLLFCVEIDYQSPQNTTAKLVK